MENFRLEPIYGTRVDILKRDVDVLKRDPVEPEPVGSLIVTAFRITGYDQDCDGSLMARLEQIDKDGKATGWEPTQIGLYPSTDLVTTADEWRSLFAE